MSSLDFPTFRAPGAEAKITNITTDFTMEALGQLVQHISLNAQIPIERILGFDKFAAEASPMVTTQETTSSTSYTNLATDGPSLTGLSAGKYLVIVAAWASTSNVTYAAQTSVSVNGAAPTDNDAAISGAPSLQSVLAISLQTLTLDNNTLKMQYKITNAAATGTWGNRRLTAIRYANP